jgi:hypothetical protein
MTGQPPTTPPPAPLPDDPRPCRKCRRRTARAQIRWYRDQLAAGADPALLDAGEPATIRQVRAALRAWVAEWGDRP